MDCLDLIIKDILWSKKFNRHVDLTPFQMEVFKEMLRRDYLVFRGARRTGKTFLLSLLYSFVAAMFRDIKVGVISPSVRETKAVNTEINKFGFNYDVCSVSEFQFDAYDIILVDGASRLAEMYLNKLVYLIQNKKCKKIIFTSNGYYSFNNFLPLEYLVKQQENSNVIVKNYKDVPDNFHAFDSIKEAMKIMSEDEFKQEYLAEIVYENISNHLTN